MSSKLKSSSVRVGSVWKLGEWDDEDVPENMAEYVLVVGKYNQHKFPGDHFLFQCIVDERSMIIVDVSWLQTYYKCIHHGT